MIGVLHRAIRRAGMLAFRTFCQTLAGILAASGAGLLDADWLGAVSAAGMAGLIAFLMHAADHDDRSGDPVDRPGPGGPVHRGP